MSIRESIQRLFESEVGSTLYTSKGTPIKRYKGIVGKEIGGQLYLHKDYVDKILPYGDITYDDYKNAVESLPDGTYFECVMFDKKKRTIRFDEAPDFDTAREPIPGNYISLDLNSMTYKNGFSDYIWHHKWLWVMNDYTGFNVAESWEWSKRYLSVLKDTGDPLSNRGIANGSGHGDKNWKAQLKYFGLE